MSRKCLALLVVMAVTAPAGAQPPARPADAALAVVPTDAFLVASVKVSKLWDNPGAKPLRDWYAQQKIEPLARLIGLYPGEIDRVTYFRASWNPDAGGLVILITTREQYKEAAVRAALKVRKEEDHLQQLFPSRVHEVEDSSRWVVFIDDRTILYLEQDRDAKRRSPNLIAMLLARKPDGPLAAALALAEKHDAIAAVDLRGVAQYGKLIGLDRDKMLIPYLPLLQAKTAVLTADVDRTAKVEFTLAFADAETAKRAAPVLAEAIKALHGERSKDLAGSDDALRKVVEGWVLNLLQSAKVAANGANVVAAAEMEFAVDIAKLVVALPKEFGVVSEEATVANNLKNLAIGLHSIHDNYTYIPGDVTAGDMPLAWSWRVQILPYLEHDKLFKQLTMTVAWDHPVNLQVLEKMEMPKVFEHPGRPAPKGHTYFRVFSLPKNAKGTERPFFKEGEKGPKFSDVTDGLSNTLMIVEAAEAVPWYKPDVLAYDGKLPLPQLGAKEADKFLAAMGDGSVRTFKPRKLGEKTLRALITINGGEVFESPK